MIQSIIDDSYTAGFSEIEHMDEMLDRSGNINPHWHAFIQTLSTLGLEEMAVCHKAVVRLLRENGVTYVVHGEKQRHRPWELDPIPLIISPLGLGGYLGRSYTTGRTVKSDFSGFVRREAVNQGRFDTAGSCLCSR